jgi:UDP-N-acetylmuramoylalanine--D-glutamate ligase
MSETTEHIFNREPVDPRGVRSVCVLGDGVTGAAVARFFRALPNPPAVTVLTGDAEALDAEAVNAGIGDADAPDAEAVDASLEGGFDLAVTSPGIPPHSALITYARARARELISEPELAFRLFPERWIAITGTNGKTTTTALTAHVLNACGMKARVAGNIGTTCIEAAGAREPGEYLVVELSSYQLAYSSTIAPDAAVLLNITPDHLSWHGSFSAYRAAKLSLFDRMVPAAPAIIDATLDETRAAVRARRAAQRRTIPLGTADGLQGDMTVRCGAPEAAFVDPNTHELTCVIDGRRIAVMEASRLAIRGVHNQENALAAAATALALGAAPEQVACGLASFEPLEHRIEPCGVVGGVAFLNDSKATNPEATLTALAAFEDTPLVVMLGGRDKNTSLDALVAAAVATCRAVVCYGEAGPRFARDFETAAHLGSLAVLHAADFSAAFAAAAAAAEAGDAVLLSPACASFDEFFSYEQRGTAFKELVGALRAQRAGMGARDGS